MSVRKVYHLYCFDPDNLEDRKCAVRIKALSPGWPGTFPHDPLNLYGPTGDR